MRTTITTLAAAIAIASPSGATVLLRDQMTSGAGWGINQGPDTDSSATFGYDYSADGIPEAPNFQGGDAATSGLKLEANNGDANAVAAFVTAFPTGQSFTGSYSLRFDAWMAFDSDERAGSAVGTTEFLGGGIGYDGVTADVASGAQAIATGDGGSGSDWRAFKSPPQFFLDTTAMTGLSRNGSDSHYADFLPAVDPPAGSGMTAQSVAGSPGLQWITWDISTIGNTVSIDIEKPGGARLNIATYDKTDTSDGSAGVNTDGNISIFYADFFSSVTPRPDRTFGIVDNVVVTQIPEPTATLLLALAGCAAIAVRRRRHSGQR